MRRIATEQLAGGATPQFVDGFEKLPSNRIPPNCAMFHQRRPAERPHAAAAFERPSQPPRPGTRNRAESQFRPARPRGDSTVPTRCSNGCTRIQLAKEFFYQVARNLGTISRSGTNVIDRPNL